MVWRKVALSQNLMDHQILPQVLLWAHPALDILKDDYSQLIWCYVLMVCPSVQSCCCSCLHFVTEGVTSRGYWTSKLAAAFPMTFLQCIAIPNSNWLKQDPDCTKTAEELDALLCEDSKLFIEVSILCLHVFLPCNTADRTEELKLSPFSTFMCLCH